MNAPQGLGAELINNKEQGCYATLGYKGPGFGEHSINLEGATPGYKSCVTKATVIHEALHIMGVQHEQCRPDRDEYIDIHWEKMQVRIMVMQSTKFRKSFHPGCVCLQ